MSGDHYSVFELQKVCFGYDGRQTALDNINLCIHAGERIAILGSNGSGKSTLLKVMDGLYFPTSGEICAFGSPLSEEAFRDDEFNFNFRRRVSLVFQDSDVQLFSPSVWDEIAFAPLQLGLSRDEVLRRVDEAMAALRIEKLRDRAPHRLSGGEMKRVALAAVLSLKPDVWLMDEPTAGLDPRSVSWLVDFIIEQGKAGKTIVTATHDLNIVESIADRIYVIDEHHHIVAEGTPDHILSNHELLIACNLMHEHRHWHGSQAEGHAHPHLHLPLHEHEHAS
jgi:cobalt/nickel transport system ATP-binding protein